MNNPTLFLSGLSKNAQPIKERTWIAFLFIFFCIMALPMFRTDLMLGHDIQHSFFKVIGLYTAWSDFNLLGRWIPDVAYGYGYPMFNFYAPLFSWIGTTSVFLLQNFVLGFNAAMALSLFLSGLTMYYFAKRFWGPPGAFVSAIAYLYAPYHILDIYVRGACAESLAFVFFPLVLLFVYRIHSEENRMNLVWGSLAVAGLCLSHNFMGMLGLAMAFSFSVFLHLTEGQEQPKRVLKNFLIFSWGIALATFFWLPALVEKQFIQLPRILEVGNNYKANFFSLSKFFYSPWSYSYNITGVEIGPAHLFLAIAACSLAKKNAPQKPALWRHTIFWALVILASVFFMTQSSLFLWDFLRLYKFMNFPWRFLAFVICAVSFLAGGAIFYCPERHRATCLIAAVASLVFLNIAYCHPMGFKTVEITAPKQFLFRENPGDSMENLPMWVPNVRQLFEPNPQKLSLLIGKAAIVSYKTRYGLEHSYRIKAATQLLVLFHTFYFPGWNIYIDQKKTDFLIHTKSGAFIFTIPIGEHDVTVRFEDTPVRLIGNSISVVSALLLGLFAIFRSRNKAIPPKNKLASKELDN